MTGHGFELTPAERAVAGITLRSDRLVIRPAARFVGAGAFVILIGVAMAVVPLFGPAALFLVTVAGLLVVATGWRYATARIDATVDGLKVRNVWRTRMLTWNDIQAVTMERVDLPGGYLPGMPYPASHHFIAVITLVNGKRIASDATRCRPVQDAAPGALQTEVEVEVLSQWMSKYRLPATGPK